jgi:mono/diheme cytochrome c family protein
MLKPRFALLSAVASGLVMACFLPQLGALEKAAPAEQTTEFSAADLEYFRDVVEPVLAQHCYGCHGNGKDKGGLSFYTRAGLLKGGESGAVVDWDNLPASPLLEAINYTGLQMPPSGKISAERINILTEWLRRGAPMPVREDAVEAAHHSPQVNEQTRAHWAFRPVQRPPVPAVANPAWSVNPVDSFIMAQLVSRDLQPNPPTDRRVLIRRVYYDLLGLPPSPEEVEEFARNTDPQAYPQLIEKLLSSPHYGEHWARYWLDVVRYAESNSFERDNPKPFVWKYRDYVIRAFNEDKPYDQFIIEQLAGDELADPSKDAIIATGYYRLGAWDDEPADPELARYDDLDDILATTSQGLLGLTMNCCRCHEHKLDPLPHADYYRFLAFFINTERYGVRGDDSIYARSVRDISTPAEQAQFQQELVAYQARVEDLREALDVVEEQILEHLVGGEKDDFQNDSVRLRIIRKYVGQHISREDFETYARQRREWTDLRNNPPRSAEQALCIKEKGLVPPKTFVLTRGNPQAPADEVQPGFPEVLGFPDPEITPAPDGKSSGRRMALARWIASPDNPLTARVMVNRIWQGHFGRGLVRSPNNFGLQGDPPTHPELLDWLAAEFVENGWSIKHLHRVILLSQAYQMSSAGNARALEIDPVNDLFWRFDMRRLRAEEIRDSILAVNGTLNLSKMYGRSIYPIIPAEVLAGQSQPGHNWEQSSPEDRNRRSIYIHIKRSLTVPLLAAFDVADTDFTCPVRFSTTQPTQALGMLNSTFLNEEAAKFAQLLTDRAGNDPAQQVTLALERAFQRPPQPAEIERGISLIRELQLEHGQSPADALKNFCLLALNTNEFLYLD